MISEDDAELVSRCLRGDPQAFEPLVARYEKVLFNVALRMVGNYEDAQDIAQTSFVKAYEKLASYDPRYRFFSWIYRIMMNESLNVLGRQKTHQPLDPGLTSADDPGEQARLQELSEQVQAGLMELPQDHREVLVLRHFGELSYVEMSSLLGIPEKTVKSRLYTARQRLAERLQMVLAPGGKA
jgi:RNA polymerase sigma-70 factor, ECF subfamily